MASYIDNLMTFIDRQRSMYNVASVKGDVVPVVEPSEYVIEGRTYKHFIDLSKLNYNTKISYVPAEMEQSGAGMVFNSYTLEGKPIETQEEYELLIQDKCILFCAGNNGLKMAEIAKFAAGSSVDGEVHLECRLYFPDAKAGGGLAEWERVSGCISTHNIVDNVAYNYTPSVSALPSDVFVDGHYDLDSGEFYYNLVSEQNMEHNGVVYEHLLVHDLRMYATECTTACSYHLFMLETPSTGVYTVDTLGAIRAFPNEPEDADYHGYACEVDLLDKRGSGLSGPGDDSINEHLYEIHTSLDGETLLGEYLHEGDFSFVVEGNTNNYLANNVRACIDAFVELKGSQLFVYFNVSPYVELGE